MPWRTALIVGTAAGIILGALTLIVMLTDTRVQHTPVETAVDCVGMAVAMALLVGLGAWTDRRQIARLAGRCAQFELTALARELASLHGRQNRIIERLLAEPATDRRFARVVCCEPVLMPDVGDIRFEPFIVRAGVSSGWALLFVVTTGGLWAFSYLFPIAPIVCLIGRFAGVLALSGGVPIVVLALFDLLFRMRYIRVAPGQVDILTYDLFCRTPRFKRIPLDADTVVFFRSAKDSYRLLTAEIVRDKKTLRVVDFPGQPPGAVEHVWWAVHAPWQPLPLPTEALTD